MDRGHVLVSVFCALLLVQSPGGSDIVAISEEAAKAIVVVVTSDGTGKRLAQGSGFLVTEDGKLMTNLHLLTGAASAIVKFSDGGFYEVEGFLGTDAHKDIAILKIHAPGKEFPFLRMADAHQVQVGQHVVAIGSPLALEGSVSDGIISAVRNGRELSIDVSDDFKVFQTTAPVSPGSSGGALLNMQGEAIGIVSFGFVEGQNLNFAIPVEYARSLISNESVRTLVELPSDRTNSESTGAVTRLVGTYVGRWKSRLNGSGVLVLTVRVDSGVLHANALITGSSSGYKGDSMAASKLKDMGDGVWAVELKGEHSNLDATGIFTPGSFVGDFRHHVNGNRPPDHGRWVVTRQ
jgi:S1-C subfamily serine protease